VIKKEGEKILKYQDLIIEIDGIWSTKRKVIQVIISNGKITKSFIKYLEQRNRKARNQDTTESYSGQCTHTEESTNYKTSITVNNIRCSINGNYSIAATIYHRNMVCFRHTTVNNLHEIDK